MHTIQQTWRATDSENGLEYKQQLTAMLTAIKEEVEVLLNSVNIVSGDIMKINLCIEEACLNAIIHGNLGVGSEARELQSEAFIDEQRKVTGQRLQKVVEVSINIGDKKNDTLPVSITVKDEGDGFNYHTLPDPTDDDRIGMASGRGILLMRQFMNAQFSDEGRIVNMKRDCEVESKKESEES